MMHSAANHPPLMFLTTLSDSATTRLLDLMKLRDGWYFGRGLAPSRALSMKAYLLIQFLRKLGFSKLGVFPAETGEIEVTAYAGDGFVSVICRNDDAFDLVGERDGSEILASEGLAEAVLRRQIRDFAWQLGTTFDSFTPYTLMRNSADTRVSPSGTPKVVEYQLSTARVSMPAQPHSATIYVDTTILTSPAILRYSGASTATFSLPQQPTSNRRLNPGTSVIST